MEPPPLSSHRNPLPASLPHHLPVPQGLPQINTSYLPLTLQGSHLQSPPPSVFPRHLLCWTSKCLHVSGWCHSTAIWLELNVVMVGQLIKWEWPGQGAQPRTGWLDVRGQGTESKFLFPLPPGKRGWHCFLKSELERRESMPVIPAGAGGRRIWVQGLPWLCREFEDSLGYMRLCLKKQKQSREKLAYNLQGMTQTWQMISQQLWLPAQAWARQ